MLFRLERCGRIDVLSTQRLIGEVVTIIPCTSMKPPEMQ